MPNRPNAAKANITGGTHPLPPSVDKKGSKPILKQKYLLPSHKVSFPLFKFKSKIMMKVAPFNNC